MISIIIPTLNEEKYLPKLLDCIKKQSYKDYEIIVVDGNSKDKTREIAKNYGCRVYNEPEDIDGHPGIARNLGAYKSKGDILLFLEADIQIEINFLEKALKEFSERKLDIAGFYFISQNPKLIYKIILCVYNFLIFVTQSFYANANGGALMCKKWLFKKVKGFDETIKFAEDFDFVNRCGKYGRFRLIKSMWVKFSVRRFESEGVFKLAFKYMLSGAYRTFFGPDRQNIFKWYPATTVLESQKKYKKN